MRPRCSRAGRGERMRLPALLLAFGLSAAALAAAPQAGPRPDHVPERECLDCHAGQAALWAGSKHARAMQAATPESVLGDFAGARFAGGGEQARFLRRNERFVVAGSNERGEPAELPVSRRRAAGCRPSRSPGIRAGGNGFRCTRRAASRRAATCTGAAATRTGT